VVQLKGTVRGRRPSFARRRVRARRQRRARRRRRAAGRSARSAAGARAERGCTGGADHHGVHGPGRFSAACRRARRSRRGDIERDGGERQNPANDRERRRAGRPGFARSSTTFASANRDAAAPAAADRSRVGGARNDPVRRAGGIGAAGRAQRTAAAGCERERLRPLAAGDRRDARCRHPDVVVRRPGVARAARGRWRGVTAARQTKIVVASGIDDLMGLIVRALLRAGRGVRRHPRDLSDAVLSPACVRRAGRILPNPMPRVALDPQANRRCGRPLGRENSSTSPTPTIRREPCRPGDPCQLRESLPDDVLLFLDEAYADFRSGRRSAARRDRSPHDPNPHLLEGVRHGRGPASAMLSQRPR